MTHTHPDQSPIPSSRWRTPIWLVVCLVLTAYFAVKAWSDASFRSLFVLTVLADVMLTAKLLGRRWGWNEAVIERAWGILFVAGFFLAILLDGFIRHH
jgi:hypothetical protein